MEEGGKTYSEVFVDGFVVCGMRVETAGLALSQGAPRRSGSSPGKKHD